MTNIMNNLPEEIQAIVKSTLRAYNEVTISFENGEYHVSTGTMIKAHYASDHKVVGYVSVNDIYTEIEQMETILIASTITRIIIEAQEIMSCSRK